jgi:hypothetical protein
MSDVVSICRRCGWYASLGAFVELDPDWETDLEPATTAAPAPRPLNLRDWIKLVPRWGWIIIASVLFVMAESIVARLVTPAGSWVRTAWSLGQLTIGALAVAGCHIFNFLVLAADDADVGLLDLLLKPLKLWTRAIQNLPERLWVADAAASGLVATVLSLAVIGGISYDRLWDWGFTQPVKRDLMGAVMNRVKQLDSGNGNDDLEGAIGDFAGSQDATGTQKAQPPKPKSSADCVIIGFVIDRDGRLSTLLLGTANGGRLIYAGNVTPKMSNDDLNMLAAKLNAIRARQAILAIQAEAIWVQPKYTCRVSFGERTKSGTLRDIEWGQMLGNIKTR